MALEGWLMLTPKQVDMFMHRMITSQKFGSEKYYRHYHGKTMRQLELTMQEPAMRIHLDIHLADLF